MITLETMLVWAVMRILQGHPIIFLPASIVAILLGAFVSFRIVRQLKKLEAFPFGCLAFGSLFEYSLYGFLACLTSPKAIWLWLIWGPGALISQILASGWRFPDRWLPFQRRWARPGLAWFSFFLLTTPLLLVGAEGVLSIVLLPAPEQLSVWMFWFGVLAWTAWAPVLVWRLLVS